MALAPQARDHRAESSAKIGMSGRNPPTLAGNDSRRGTRICSRPPELRIATLAVFSAVSEPFLTSFLVVNPQPSMDFWRFFNIGSRTCCLNDNAPPRCRRLCLTPLLHPLPVFS